MKSVLVGVVALWVGLSLQPGMAEDTNPHYLDGSSWQIAPQADVKESGEEISKPDYKPSDWLPAQVPGTVFGSYVLAGKEKDPNYADNIYKVDIKKYDRNFWYRTAFTVPAETP